MEADPILRIHAEKEDDSYFNLTNADLVALIPEHPGCILDVGCAAGRLGEDIIKAKHPDSYVGIELVPAIAQQARQRLTEVIEGNAEQILPTIDAETFDWVIMADILEHTIDPWRFMLEIRRILRPGGKLLVSIPNVRNLGVIFDLVCRGRWTYQPFGIMDRGHLRFFTRRTIHELLMQNHFEVEYCCSNRRNRWKRWRGKTIARILAFLLFQPSSYEEFITVQWLIVARKT